MTPFNPTINSSCHLFVWRHLLLVSNAISKVIKQIWILKFERSSQWPYSWDDRIFFYRTLMWHWLKVTMAVSQLYCLLICFQHWLPGYCFPSRYDQYKTQFVFFCCRFDVGLIGNRLKLFITCSSWNVVFNYIAIEGFVYVLTYIIRISLHILNETDFVQRLVCF